MRQLHAETQALVAMPGFNRHHVRPVDKAPMPASEEGVDEAHQLPLHDCTENRSSVLLRDRQDLARNCVRTPYGFLDALAFPIFIRALEQTHLHSRHDPSYTCGIGSLEQSVPGSRQFRIGPMR